MGKFHKEWSQITTLLDRWIAFLTRAGELDHKSLPAAMQAEPAITKAVVELERISGNRRWRDAYEAQEKAKMVDAATLEHVEKRGIQQGVHQGQQRMLLRQMVHHIGEVPADIQARLGTLTPAQLEDLGEALFDLHSFAEIEAWLSRQ